MVAEINIRRLMLGAWILLALLNVVDAWATLHILNSVPGAVEANPIMRWMMEYNLFIVAKAWAVGLAGIWCFKTKTPVTYTAILSLAVVIYSYVAFHNLRYIF